LITAEELDEAREKARRLGGQKTKRKSSAGARILTATRQNLAPGARGRNAAGNEETTLIKGLGPQRLVALFFGGMVLFNFPLLALWDRDLTLFGVPLLPAALFIGWGVLIAVLGWTVERIDH